MSRHSPDSLLMFVSQPFTARRKYAFNTLLLYQVKGETEQADLLRTKWLFSVASKSNKSE